MFKFTIPNVACVFLLSGSALTALAQPCVNGISTNPNNPVNNQFVQLGNNFWPGNGTDTYNPWLNAFDWYLGSPTIQLFPNQVNWSHGFSNNLSAIQMQHPYGGGMPSQFDYLRPNPMNLGPAMRDFRWEDGWELLYLGTGFYPNGEDVNVEALTRAYAPAYPNVLY